MTSVEYLNDLIWAPAYREIGIFDIQHHQFRGKLSEVLSKTQHFVPFELVNTKVLSNALAMITAVVGPYILMFQLADSVCQLFFVFRVHAESIMHVKLRRDENLL